MKPMFHLGELRIARDDAEVRSLRAAGFADEHQLTDANKPHVAAFDLLGHLPADDDVAAAFLRDLLPRLRAAVETRVQQVDVALLAAAEQFLGARSQPVRDRARQQLLDVRDLGNA